MNQQQLDRIIEGHGHWLRKDCKGWRDMRADLSGADLRNIDLSGADLSNADLSGADLQNANLRYTDLHNADLHDADLRGASLVGANLLNADMHNARLRCARLGMAKMCSSDLHDTNLSYADLFLANLTDANMRNADLQGANFCDAAMCNVDLCDVDLCNANLSETDLSNARNIPRIPMACPESGAFTGWKVIKGFIMELLITKNAKRSSGTGRKCRCSEAVVVSIEDTNGVRHDDPEKGFQVVPDHDADGICADGTEAEAQSNRNNIVYRVGRQVNVEHFDDNRFKKYAQGITFFTSRWEAVKDSEKQE